MPEPNPTTEFFDTLAKVLLRSWVFGFLLLLVWTALMLLAGDFFYGMQAAMFGLSRHELELLSYGALALFKLLILGFFFFPWLAIRLVLRGRRS